MIKGKDINIFLNAFQYLKLKLITLQCLILIEKSMTITLLLCIHFNRVVPVFQGGGEALSNIHQDQESEEQTNGIVSNIMSFSNTKSIIYIVGECGYE